MLLKDYFPNLNKKYHKVRFKGKLLILGNKKGIYFFAFKGNSTDEIYLLKMQLKMDLK